MSRSCSSGASSASRSSCSDVGSNSADSIPLSSSLSKMRETIRDALYDDVTVEEFVQHVWGIRSVDIERILDGNHCWNISQSLLKDYKDAYGRMNEDALVSRRAGNVFTAFLDIIEEVLRDIRLRLHNSTRPTACVAFKYNADYSKTDGPDLATVWDPASKPEWPVIQTIFEFERPLLPCANDLGTDCITPVSEGFSASSSYSGPSHNSSSSSRSSFSSSAGATSCTTNASHSSSKASSYDGEKLNSSNHSARSQRPKDRINKGELRLAQKTLECLSSCNRRYMTGIYVNACSVTLWHYDRMSAIRSHSFNIEDSPASWALVIYAITRCDVFQSGYDRFHEFPNTPFGAQIPTRSLKGSRLVIPTTGASYCFQITRDKPVYASHELFGRGTKVYPVILQPDEDEVLIDGEEQVLKLYWPNTDDPPEADTIKKLYHDVPQIVDHLPAISFSSSFTTEELKLPSFLLKSYSSPDSENRLLHMFTMRRYEKLWEVRSVEEFKEVFLDCVECHFHAYRTGHVLHRDLSENNLMVWRPRRSTIRSRGQNLPSTHTRALGILNDWDMATRVTRYSGVASIMSNDSSLAALKKRTGTVPFMALDLLSEHGPTPIHLYRHDLESFLWILIWAAVHYDIQNKRNLSALPGKIDKELRIWDEGTREEVYACKRALLRRASSTSPRSSADGADSANVLDRVRPEFQKIKTEWIIPLIRMFHRAYNELHYTDVDEETCGGIVTFSTFMAAINRTPRLAPSSSEDGWNSCVIS